MGPAFQGPFRFPATRRSATRAGRIGHCEKRACFGALRVEKIESLTNVRIARAARFAGAERVHPGCAAVAATLSQRP